MADPSHASEQGLPGGTVTFLFTDIEGSTSLWERHPEAMGPALARHNVILRAAIQGHGGYIFATAGDGASAVFTTASDALAAALDAQLALHAEAWGNIPPLRVRMALHTGAAEQRDGEYVGPALNRVARLLGLGHGGQTLLSAAVQELVRDRLPPDVSLADLGEHPLRDLDRPERVTQLCHLGLPREFPPLRSQVASPPGLPRQLTSFVGREEELAEIERLLATTRLFTLTGVGGIGKTRLALRIAERLADPSTSSGQAYPDGVWLVELAPLSDSALVPQAVATTLGVREQPGSPLSATLADVLRPRTSLLLLDNCEHLVAACATLADGLLRACPLLTILATSREPLRTVGETVWRVPPLSAPDTRPAPVTEEARRASILPDAHALTQYAAVRLFVERAQAALPSFALTHANSASVVQICQRLDGIPLAIELAAARVRGLTPEQIVARLGDHFRLLTGGSRTAPPRHQTLRALVDWSHELLSEFERVLLHRLSVFAGGWTLEAAEAVCADDHGEDNDVLDHLSRLVDRSLVSVEASGGEARYRLLETIRAYALEQLEASGEAEAIRRRHAEWYLALAQRTEPELKGLGQGAWLDQLEAEHDNLRATLGWMVEHGETKMGLKLGATLWTFWRVRGYRTEGIDRLAALLALPGASDHLAERAIVLYGLGILAYGGGDFATSRSCQEESLAISRELDDKEGVFRSLSGLGYVATTQGDYGGARAFHEEALTIARVAGDRRGLMYALGSLGWVAQSQGENAEARSLVEQSLAIGRDLGDARGIARSLSSLGYLAHIEGDYGAANAYDEESLAIRRDLGDRWGIALSLLHLGWLRTDQGNHSEARALLAESLTTAREIGDMPIIADGLEVFAKLALAVGGADLAARLLGAAERLREAIGAPLSPSDRADCHRDVVATRTALGKAKFAAAWAAGRAMPLDRAIGDALRIEVIGPSGVAVPEQWAAAPQTRLTPREREVAALIARGLTNRQIAEALVISERTASTHVTHILNRLGFTTRAQVAAWAVEQGLAIAKIHMPDT